MFDDDGQDGCSVWGCTQRVYLWEGQMSVGSLPSFAQIQEEVEQYKAETCELLAAEQE